MKTLLILVKSSVLAFLSLWPLVAVTTETDEQKFLTPKHFWTRDLPLATDYLDSYHVSNASKKLATWQLYNLCNLILAANRDTYARQGQTFEVGTYSQLFKLLRFNVPDLELDYEQYADVYFLADAAVAIKKRFGNHLEALAALRRSPAWHQIWMDHQHWQGIKFGRLVKSVFREGILFDVVNLDPTNHQISFLVSSPKLLKASDFKIRGHAWISAGWWQGTPSSTGMFTVPGRTREHFLLSFKKPVSPGEHITLSLIFPGSQSPIETIKFMNSHTLQHL